MQEIRGGLIGHRLLRQPGAGAFLLGAAATVVLAVVGVLVFGGAVGSDRLRLTLGDSVSAPLAWLGAIAALVAAIRARGRSRWGWSLLSVGVALWATGETVWFFQHVLRVDLGLTGVDDTCYLLGMAPVVVGTAAFPGRAWAGADRLRAVLDAVTIGGAVFFLARGFGLFQPGDGTVAQQLLALAYPAGDVAMLCVALMVLLRAPRPWYLSLGLLVAALLSYAVGDSVFAVRSEAGTYASGTLLDLTWNLSYLLIALAAIAPGAPGATPIDDGDLSYRGRRAPWLLIGLVILVTTGFALLHPTALDDPVMVVIGVVVAITFSLRQVWVFRDLSRLNLRLTRQAEQAQRMAAAVVDGILVVNRRGQVVYANEAAALLLGAPRDDLEGRPIASLLRDPEVGSDEVPALPASSVLDAMRTSTTVTQAGAAFARADGTSIPVDVSVGPLGHLAPAGVILVFRDASVRRAVERMKNEFMSVISHEVRTPLTSIRGALALLDAGVTGRLEPTSSRMVSIALESSDRLARLINDILDVERLESGSLHLDLAAHEARRLVDVAVREMAGLAETAHVSVTADPTDGVVLADADRVVQVLTNLVGNAIKFSPAGSAVRVGASRVGEMVEFHVVDQGRGVPADKLRSIFDRFEQVDSSDSRQKGGTGLGLAICQDLVRLHGGHIWARSEPAAGADFRFVLPQPAAVVGQPGSEGVTSDVGVEVPPEEVGRPARAGLLTASTE